MPVTWGFCSERHSFLVGGKKEFIEPNFHLLHDFMIIKCDFAMNVYYTSAQNSADVLLLQKDPNCHAQQNFQRLFFFYLSKTLVSRSLWIVFRLGRPLYKTTLSHRGSSFSKGLLFRVFIFLNHNFSKQYQKSIISGIFSFRDTSCRGSSFYRIHKWIHNFRDHSFRSLSLLSPKFQRSIISEIIVFEVDLF